MPTFDTTDNRTCNECGDVFDYDMSGMYCDGCDEYFCSDCSHNAYECEHGSDDYYGRSRNVHSWDYRPSPYRPKGNYPAEPLLGLELEVGGSATRIVNAVHTVDDSEHHLYMKDDGSIDGVEIVSHPATLAWSRGFDYARICRELVNGGCRVDDGYGLHVHVSRNAFRYGAGKRSASHQMTWLLFLYRNSERIERLARRVSDRWASFRDPERGELKRKAEPFEGRRGDDRYVAVNCNNERTYELRFFKSTLDVVELMAALEFADASVNYTRTLNSANVLRGDGLRWATFSKWVKAQTITADDGTDTGEPAYPNLTSELERVAAEPEPPVHRRFTLDEALAIAGIGGRVGAVVNTAPPTRQPAEHETYRVARRTDSWTGNEYTSLDNGYTSNNVRNYESLRLSWYVLDTADGSGPVLDALPGEQMAFAGNIG